MMKKHICFYLLIACVALLIVLGGCSVAPEKEKPIVAEVEVAKAVNMIFAGASSGDSTEIMEYMENEEGGMVLKDLLIEDGINLEEVTPKCVDYLDMPLFGDTTVYQDGDVLFLRDYQHLPSNLLDWLIPSLYTHVGVFDRDAYNDWTEANHKEDPRDAPCVMSAVLAAEMPALTRQTWRHWASASVVSRMRVQSDYSVYLKNLWRGKSEFEYFNSQDTIYGFVAPLHDPVTDKYILVPVPNVPRFGSVGDPLYDISNRYWHCSKTAWYVFFASGFTKGIYNPTGINPFPLSSNIPDLENNDWYFRPGVNIKTFGFYKLYKALLILEGMNPIEAGNEAKIQIEQAIRMVAIPDEIRFATTNRTELIFGQAGPLDEKSRVTWGPWGQNSEMLLKLF